MEAIRPSRITVMIGSGPLTAVPVNEDCTIDVCRPLRRLYLQQQRRLTPRVGERS
jgi:hypothetical protein